MTFGRKVGIGIVIASSIAIAITAPMVHRHNYRTEPTFDNTPTLPVHMRVSPSMRGYAADIREAIAIWDRAAGCPTVVLDTSAAAVTLGLLGVDDWCGRDTAAGGATAYCADGTRDIRFSRLEENATARIAHEIGHALGHRAHDPAGIMAASVEEFGAAYVTARDKDELRKACE